MGFVFGSGAIVLLTGIVLGIGAIVLLMCITLSFFMIRIHKYKGVITGPFHGWRSIVFGNFGDGAIPVVSRRHRFYAEMHQAYGDVTRVLQPLGNSSVIFTGMEIPDWFSKQDCDSKRDAFRTIIPNSLLAFKMGHEWATHRKLIAPLFGVKSLSGLLPKIQSSSVELEGILAARINQEPDAAVDLYPLLHAWSLDIIGKVAFGHVFGALQSHQSGAVNKYSQAASVILKEMIRKATQGPIAHLDRAKCREAEAAIETYRECVQNIIKVATKASAETDTAVDEEVRSSFIGRLVRAPDTEHRTSGQKGKAAPLSAKLSNEAAIHEGVGLLIAGHETSSNTACWALYLLASNPDVQRTVTEEVDAVYEAAGPAGISLEALFSMKLVFGTVYEALRLFPTIPLTFKSVSREGLFPGLPKGGLVSPDKTAMGRDPRLFPNPEEFDPKRYVRNEHGKHGSRIAAFGAGPRLCVGYRLAETELLSVIAQVLRSFTLSAVDCPEPKEYVDVSNGPKVSGLFLRLTPRSSTT